MRHGLTGAAGAPGPDRKIGQLPDSPPVAGPYNGFMTTIHDHSAATVAPQFAWARSLLEGLAAQDFAQLGGALAPEARLRALLPLGLREWTGAEDFEIAGSFAAAA